MVSTWADRISGGACRGIRSRTIWHGRLPALHNVAGPSRLVCLVNVWQRAVAADLHVPPRQQLPCPQAALCMSVMVVSIDTRARLHRLRVLLHRPGPMFPGKTSPTFVAVPGSRVDHCDASLDILELLVRHAISAAMMASSWRLTGRDFLHEGRFCSWWSSW